MSSTKAKPVHEVRLGRIKAAIWANDTEAGIRHNVSFARIYHTEAGWESTASFGRDDLPLLMKVADQAHDWIFAQGSDSAGQRQERPVESAPRRNGQSGSRRNGTPKHEAEAEAIAF